jgi:hypothetical protein
VEATDGGFCFGGCNVASLSGLLSEQWVVYESEAGLDKVG